MVPFLKSGFGNPSLPHWSGHAAKETVILTRERVSKLLGCSSDGDYFYKWN